MNLYVKNVNDEATDDEVRGGVRGSCGKLPSCHGWMACIAAWLEGWSGEAAQHRLHAMASWLAWLHGCMAAMQPPCMAAWLDNEGGVRKLWEAA
jgi:hypothetical protein